MTNQELIEYIGKLSHRERERRYLLRALLSTMPCPHCGSPIDYFSVIGININDLDPDGKLPTEGRCPDCSGDIRYTVRFTGKLWEWRKNGPTPELPSGKESDTVRFDFLRRTQEDDTMKTTATATTKKAARDLVREADLLIIESMIDRYGIDSVLMGVSSICGAKAEHISHAWQDAHLAKRWAELEGALGVLVPKAVGL
jgi:hypothetical protein